MYSRKLLYFLFITKYNCGVGRVTRTIKSIEVLVKNQKERENTRILYDNADWMRLLQHRSTV
jgi:hypothetical protein